MGGRLCAMGLLAWLVLLVLLPGEATAAAGAWYWQNPLPQGNSLGEVAFTGERRALAIGDAGTLLRTRDDGRSWTFVPTGIAGTLFGLKLRDSGEGWAVGSAGVVLRSDDAGEHWRQLAAPTTQALMDVGLPARRTAVAVGERGLILRTTDDGSTWERRPTGTTHNLLAVTFAGTGGGWAVGDLGTILHSGDKGRTWQVRGQSVFGTLNDVLTMDKDVVLVAASLGSVWRGTNKGRTWKRVRVGVSSALYALAPLGGKKVAAVGEGGVLVVSDDAGKTWRLRRQPGASLFGLAFSKRGTGLTVGASGRILRSPAAATRWTTVGGGTTRVLRALEVTASRAWAVGDDGTLLSKRDAQLWRPVSTGVSEQLKGVSFADALHGCTVGDAGTILHSSDGGASWRRAESPTTQDLADVDLSAQGWGWAVGAGGTILRSPDRGAGWRFVKDDPDVDLRAVLGRSDRAAVAVGGDPWGQAPAVVTSTADGGATWRTTELDVFGTLEDVAFSSALVACAVGVDFGLDGDWATGVIVRSADGGATWQRVYTTAERLYAVTFADAQHGWAAGSEGRLLATADGGQTWAPVALPATAAVRALGTDAGSGLWVAGGGGAILFTADRNALPPAPLRAAGSVTLSDVAD